MRRNKNEVNSIITNYYVIFSTNKIDQCFILPLPTNQIDTTVAAFHPEIENYNSLES